MIEKTKRKKKKDKKKAKRKKKSIYLIKTSIGCQNTAFSLALCLQPPIKSSGFRQMVSLSFCTFEGIKASSKWRSSQNCSELSVTNQSPMWHHKGVRAAAPSLKVQAQEAQVGFVFISSLSTAPLRLQLFENKRLKWILVHCRTSFSAVRTNPQAETHPLPSSTCPIYTAYEWPVIFSSLPAHWEGESKIKK